MKTKKVSIALIIFILANSLFAKTSERDLGIRPELNLTKVSAYIIKFTNEERTKRELKPLEHDKILSRAAFLHTQYLIRNRTLSHYGNPYRLPRDRVMAACGNDQPCFNKYIEKGFGRLVGCCGENIIESFALPANGVRYEIHNDDKGTYKVWLKDIGWFNEKTLAKELVQRWMDSPPHRRNILLKNYMVMGAAVLWDNDERYFAAQVFAPLRK